MRKALFLGTGGLSGMAGVKANSKKDRTAKAAEKQVRLQKQALRDSGRTAQLRTRSTRIGPHEGWLNEVATALADLGLTEIGRNSCTVLAGIPLETDIGAEDGKFRVAVNLFADSERSRQAVEGFTSKPDARKAISKGLGTFQTTDRLLYAASAHGKRVDQSRLEEVMAAIAGTALPAPVEVDNGTPATDLSAATELERLAALHERGALTAEEFAAAKARIIGS